MKLSNQAQQALDRYLRTLRVCLASTPGVDREEVEQEIRTHIERELGETGGDVGWARLQVVLDRLGSPLQWVPEESLSGWQRWRMRCAVGPEAWRLAYGALLLMLAAPAAFVVAGPWPAAASLLGAFLLARASSVDADGLEDGARARRWLTLPALLPLYALAVAVLLFGILVPEFLAAEQVLRLEAMKPRFPEVAVAVSRRLMAVLERPGDVTQTAVAVGKVGAWTLGPLGLWWMLLGSFCAWRPRWVAACFAPLSRRAARGLGWLVLVSGLAVGTTGVLLGLAKSVHFAQVLEGVGLR